MKILAIEKEIVGRTKAQFEPYLRAEAQKVRELQDRGIIKEIYFTEATHEAVIIIECQDQSEAEKILKTLPLVKERLIEFNIVSLVPYDGFERLSSYNR